MNISKYKHVVFSMAASGLLLVGLFLLLNGAPQIARAAHDDLFVTTDGTGSDCTQATPCELATALSQSVHGDTIYVAQGTYTGAGEAVISVLKSVMLFGGWDALTSTPPVRDPQNYPTTLDGENARRGVRISGAITPTLDGFIITRGNASTAAIDPGFGGGIYSSDANPIITNNVITNNVAYTSATEWGNGGGIYIQNSDDSPAAAVVSGNRITNNTASSAYRGNSGGLMVYFSSGVIIRDNIFQGNIAGSTNNGLGGGLGLFKSSAVVSGNLIQDNGATPTDDGFGGAFYSEFGDVTLSGNWIISNNAEFGAVTFQHNPNITVTNNIIAQNTGGGVFVRGNATSPFTGILAHNTIVQNGKEGVYAGWYSSGYSTLTLTNNIITGHTTGIYAYLAPNPNMVTATHTLFYDNQNDTDGTTITSTDEITGSNPLFMDSVGRNFHLRPNSPAINTGIPLLWLTTDIDGDARPLPTNGDYDIGADEADWLSMYLPVVMKSSN